MDILSVLGALVHHHRGYETLSISAGEYYRCVLEWCSLSCRGPTYPVTPKQLIATYHIFPFSIRIKSDFVTIPHLQWTRLDVK